MPEKTEKRTARILTLITEDEFKSFRDVCRLVDVSMSDAIRAYVIDAIKKQIVKK